MNSKQSGRRRFLKSSAAVVGGLAVGGIRPAGGEETLKNEVILSTGLRPLGELSRFEKTTRTGSATQGYTPLQDSQGIITPSALHFYVNHERGVLPDIDSRRHRLMIHGMVDRPVILTMAELKRLPTVSRIHFVECNANGNPNYVKEAKTLQESHGLTSCSEWTGVLLSLLLKEAGVQKGASWVLAASADTSGHASTLPMGKAMNDVLVAFYQNGESLRVENGYPLRLVCPGYAGRVHVKWLNRLKVVDQPYMTTQDRSSHMEELTPAGEGAFLITSDLARQYHFEMYPKSLITFPSGGHVLPGPGFYEITGLAWSGGGYIRKVEVSTDGGKTWKDAQLQEPVHRMAHTRFRFGWNWNGEETVIQSRCTDDRGDVQPASNDSSKNWAVDKSSACVSVLGEDCKRVPRRANRSFIMPWRVAREGSVHNAFEPPVSPAESASNAAPGEHH